MPAKGSRRAPISGIARAGQRRFGRNSLLHRAPGGATRGHGQAAVAAGGGKGARHSVFVPSHDGAGAPGKGYRRVSDASGGPGWWQASDARWYPPEQHPDYQPPPDPPVPPAPPAPNVSDKLPLGEQFRQLGVLTSQLGCLLTRLAFWLLLLALIIWFLVAVITSG